ncbi:MAG: hypothetical protein HY905_14265 [Deltaproteobacteria bacterium]|nr:hypothetical protein [Deltaproteobacteria bacterium]
MPGPRMKGCFPLSSVLPRQAVIAALGVLGLPGVAACIGDEEVEPLTSVALPSEAVSAGVLGDRCANDRDCSANLVCVDGPRGRCVCDPGRVACGTSCIDLSTDPSHCGGCDVVCEARQPCVLGSCGGITVSALASFTPPQEIDGSSATHECVDLSEAYPSRSVKGGSANILLPFQRLLDSGRYNWGLNATAWSIESRQLPLFDSTFTRRGDPWSTSSGSTYLEYASVMLSRPDPSPPYSVKWCLGVAAGNANQIDDGVWQFPLRCINTEHDDPDDGPSIQYDIGWTNFWAASKVNGHPRLYVMPLCSGQPGSSSCDIEHTVDVSTSIGGHATVAVNPCTHHAILAYRDAQHIFLDFYGTDGLRKAVAQLPGSFSFGPVSACSNPAGCSPQQGHVPLCGGACTADCGGSGGVSGGWGCARLTSKIHVATKYVSATGHCYALVAYDQLCGPAPDGQQHLKARLNVVDITAEASPVFVHGYASGGCTGSSNNDFSSTVASNQFSNAVLWYFKRQAGGDGCNTIVMGWTSASLPDPSWVSLGTVDGPFPTMSFGETKGLGDYIGGVTNGLYGGKFLATWARPVISDGTTDECASCLDDTYSLAIFGSEITP